MSPPILLLSWRPNEADGFLLASVANEEGWEAGAGHSVPGRRRCGAGRAVRAGGPLGAAVKADVLVSARVVCDRRVRRRSRPEAGAEGRSRMSDRANLPGRCRFRQLFDDADAGQRADGEAFGLAWSTGERQPGQRNSKCPAVDPSARPPETSNQIPR